MTRIALLATASFLAVLPAVAAEKPSDALGALEKKLYGIWDGNGPCNGKLVLKSDRTYERKLFGPGGNNSTGTWSLRWNALPPTLTLNCKTSDDPNHVNKAIDWKVTRLNDATLSIRYKIELQPLVYNRVKKSK